MINLRVIKVFQPFLSFACFNNEDALVIITEITINNRVMKSIIISLKSIIISLDRSLAHACNSKTKVAREVKFFSEYSPIDSGDLKERFRPKLISKDVPLSRSFEI